MTLVYLTLAWLAGIALAQWLWAQGWLGCASELAVHYSRRFGGLALVLLRRRPRLALAAAFLAAVSLGAWRYPPIRWLPARLLPIWPTTMMARTLMASTWSPRRQRPRRHLARPRQPG